MRHHFGDCLNRDYGHWSIVPNVKRWQYRYENLRDAPNNISTLTLTKNDLNWERVFNFKSLTELTLHEPSKDQLMALVRLENLIRLRISHARPKTLDFLVNQIRLKELVFEYVSGFDDLAPIQELPELKALHLENLRRVRNFSSLGSCKKLKSLSIHGTLDWAQPIESIDFLRQMNALEYFDLTFTRLLQKFPIFNSISHMAQLKEIRLGMSAVSLENFAYLHATAPNVIGAAREAYTFSEGKNRLIRKEDYRNRMPVEKFLSLTRSSVSEDGKRFIYEPPSAYLLGKGTRTVTGNKEKILKKCLAHKEKYDSLVQSYTTT